MAIIKTITIPWEFNTGFSEPLTGDTYPLAVDYYGIVGRGQVVTVDKDSITLKCQIDIEGYDDLEYLCLSEHITNTTYLPLIMIELIELSETA